MQKTKKELLLLEPKYMKVVRVVAKKKELKFGEYVQMVLDKNPEFVQEMRSLT